MEQTRAKNAAMKEAGIIVHTSFNQLGDEIQMVFTDLVQKGELVTDSAPEVPCTPKDFTALLKDGLVPKPTNFVRSVSNDRVLGNEFLEGMTQKPIINKAQF